MGSNNLRNSSYKEKTDGLARISDYLSVYYDYGCKDTSDVANKAAEVAQKKEQ